MSIRDPIKLLVPNLPQAHELMPRLMQIDARRVYTNFGPLVQEFEAALGQALQITPHAMTGQQTAVQCVTLSSGTAALELTLMALDFPVGSKVLIPSYTFAATALAVLRCGLVPVFSDVDEFSWQLTPAIAREALARMDFRLALPVATFGSPVDVQAWDDFSSQTGVAVMVDAAGGFGNQSVGLHSAVCFSLHATKPFGVGEGGFVASRDDALLAKIRQISNFGFDKGQVQLTGTNAKLSEYAAAVGLTQLARWPGLQAQRLARWHAVSDALSKVPGLKLQDGFGSGCTPSNLVILHAQAPSLRAQCTADGIETRPWYCPPLHQHAAFHKLARLPLEGKSGMDHAEHLGQYTVGLPWHDFLGREDLHRLFVALKQGFRS